jgi:hypothetical protein
MRQGADSLPAASQLGDFISHHPAGHPGFLPYICSRMPIRLDLVQQFPVSRSDCLCPGSQACCDSMHSWQRLVAPLFRLNAAAGEFKPR